MLGYPPRMPDRDEEILQELTQYLPSNAGGATQPGTEQSVTYEVHLTEPAVGAAQNLPNPVDLALAGFGIAPVELDDQTVGLARQSAKPNWYESGWTGLVMLGGPLLAIATGMYGGIDMMINIGALAFLGLLFPSCFGLLLFVLWGIYFVSYRAATKPIRQAIKTRRAWSVTGPVQVLTDRMISAGGVQLLTKRAIRIPDSAASLNCSTLYAGVGDGTQGALIAIKGPDGRMLYPATGTVPTLFKWWAVAASLLASFGLTSACSAQSQIYSDAATHLSDIKAAVQCTKDNKPGDACWKWTDGTVVFGQGSTSSDFSFFGPEVSICQVTLRWGNIVQQGDIRGDGTDCSINLTRGAQMSARIKLVRNYAIEADVAGSAYRTDKWPPLGDSAFTLALIYKVASFLWLAWPTVHLGAALLYRVRRRPRPAPVAPVTGSSPA